MIEIKHKTSGRKERRRVKVTCDCGAAFTILFDARACPACQAVYTFDHVTSLATRLASDFNNAASGNWSLEEEW